MKLQLGSIQYKPKAITVLSVCRARVVSYFFSEMGSRSNDVRQGCPPIEVVPHFTIIPLIIDFIHGPNLVDIFSQFVDNVLNELRKIYILGLDRGAAQTPLLLPPDWTDQTLLLNQSNN